MIRVIHIQGTKLEQSRKRRRKRTFDVEEKTDTTEEEKEKELAKAPAKRRRTSTFEIPKTKDEGGISDNSQVKLRRMSTFDLASKESDDQIVSEKVRYILAFMILLFYSRMFLVDE